jgi:hypothetical protein
VGWELNVFVYARSPASSGGPTKRQNRSCIEPTASDKAFEMIPSEVPGRDPEVHALTEEANDGTDPSAPQYCGVKIALDR